MASGFAPSAATLLEFANLQVAAESLYGLQKSEPNWQDNLIKNYTIESNNLIQGNNRTSKFTETETNDFVQNWEIVCRVRITYRNTT